MSYTLIPGLESFMEDTEVNVEVAVDAPEAIEEAEETADASAEIAETTEESEATDEQTEMIMAQFMELGKRYDHVKKYGVDRTFMRLYNSNDELSRSFRYRFPSCESFDSTGSPYSSESVACMEGLGSALSAIWDFIVNLCKKIGAFFGRLFEAIRVRFGNLNDQIGRLREMASERTSWVDNIDDVDATVYTLEGKDGIKGVAEKISGLEKREHLNIATLSGEAEKVMQSASRLMGNEDFAIMGAHNGYKNTQKSSVSAHNPIVNNNSSSGGSSEAEDEKKKAKDFRDAFKEAKKELRKEVSSIKDNEKVKETNGDVGGYLTAASGYMKEIDKMKSESAIAKRLLSNAETFANNQKRRGDEGNGKAQRDIASTLGTYLNLVNQLQTLKIELYTKLSGMCVRSASTILRYKKKA